MDAPNPPRPILAALASQHRCDIVWALCKRPHTVSELCELTGQNQPALSKQLKILRDAGLVDRERLHRDRRSRSYRLRDDAIIELKVWLETLLAVYHGIAYTPIDAGDGERSRDPRDTPYTTRGTPRIRKRLYWRKEDADAAERGDPEWWAKELAKAERELRSAIARRYRTELDPVSLTP